MAFAVDFGRDVCGDFAAANAREWLVTNGIGGYASGTIDGSLARCYHGLLVAALEPPGGRTLLLAKFDETCSYLGASYALATNRWASGAIDPRGYLEIERFYLDLEASPIGSFIEAPGGLMRVPNGPGLGVHVDETVLQKYRVG